jgi:hypothetical protein
MVGMCDKVGCVCYAKDFSTLLEMTGNEVVRRPSSSVNLLQKTLPSLLRNATFPLVGKARARGAKNEVKCVCYAKDFSTAVEMTW